MPQSDEPRFERRSFAEVRAPQTHVASGDFFPPTSRHPLLDSTARSLARPGALPLVLLLGALSSVFLFGHDRGHFYRDGHHDWLSSQGLAQAANLSIADGLLLFVDRTHDADGDLTYSTYARWPIGSYALIKLAILPFEGDLSATIYASRIANLLFFAAAAVVAYLAFARLAGRWVALTATLIPFSSMPALYYNDAFVPELMPALLGLLLTFHGMVVYVQEGRFGQLLAKSCLALLLCWHSYALLLPFVVLGLTQDLLREIRSDRNPSSWAAISRRSLAALRASRHLRLGFATLGFGIALLCFNLANEYMALNGKVPVVDLPTINSLEWRLEEAGDVDLADFIDQQLWFAATLALPYYGMQALGLDMPSSDFDYMGLFENVGLLLLGISCIGVVSLRHPTVLASLLFAGFVWAIAMRDYVHHHDFQALFHIGIPLVAISFAGTLLHRHLVYGCSMLAAVLFVLSSIKMAEVGHAPVQQRLEAKMLRDFQAIRSIVGDGTVFIDAHQVNSLGGAPLAASYFLTGSVVEYPTFEFDRFGKEVDFSLRHRRNLMTDYVIADKRPFPPSLTPENKHVFLYDRTFDLIIEAEFDVYFNRRVRSLHYVRSPCAPADVDARFYLHVVAQDAGVPNERSRRRFDDSFYFKFKNWGWGGDRVDGDCVAHVKLPSYAIDSISTGRVVPSTGLILAKHYDFYETDADARSDAAI